MTTEHTYQPLGWMLAQVEQDERRPKVTAAIASLPQHGEYDNPDPYYRLFMALVDKRLLRLCGFTHRDLADTDSWSLYADGSTPRQAAIEILREQDFGDELLADLGIEE